LRRLVPLGMRRKWHVESEAAISPSFSFMTVSAIVVAIEIGLFESDEWGALKANEKN
jgi:hypothetical protein